jgi:hypothetical protein
LYGYENTLPHCKHLELFFRTVLASSFSSILTNCNGSASGSAFAAAGFAVAGEQPAFE